VALICNLVQEFNGLVSKRSASLPAFLLLDRSAQFSPEYTQKNLPLYAGLGSDGLIRIIFLEPIRWFDHKIACTSGY
jgi:hypothetical protein